MFTIVPQPIEVTALDGPPAHLSSSTRLVTGSGPEGIEAGVILAGVLGELVGRAIAVSHDDDVELGPGDIVLRLDAGAGPAGSEPRTWSSLSRRMQQESDSRPPSARTRPP